MLNIVCIRQGTVYGPEYVHNLKAMLDEHLTIQHQLVCYTDQGWSHDDCCPVMDLPVDLPGWWAKLGLFKPGRLRLEGRIFYLDLDTIIIDNIDDIVSFAGDRDEADYFAILRDFYRPTGFGSAMMAWEAGQHTDIWEIWEAAGRPALQGGDQAWIEQVKPRADLWQAMFPHQIVSFKTHCLDGIPPKAKIIHFHGQPKPHQAPEWIRQRWQYPSWPKWVEGGMEVRDAGIVGQSPHETVGP